MSITESVPGIGKVPSGGFLYFNPLVQLVFLEWRIKSLKNEGGDSEDGMEILSAFGYPSIS